VLVPWSESSTWNSMSNGLQVGSELAPAFAVFPGDNNPNGDGMRRIDVRAVVQSWANGAPNYGFAILPEIISGNDDGIEIFTSESSNPLLRPAIEVVYRAPGAGLAFCAGDGSAGACPCGNLSAPGSGAGCANSLGVGGLLAASGIASLAGDTLVLAGEGMPNATVLYFQGTTRQNGGTGSPFGDGLRCAGGTVVRLAATTNVAGASRYPFGPNAPVSVRGSVGTPGVRTYQAWYRNAASFCTGDTFNLTNGVEIAWGL
jgi:hypothetical protein